MARERLEQARDLIKVKRYREARQALIGLDHPTARAWLAKLDEIAPEAEDDDPFAARDAPAARPAIKPMSKPKDRPRRRMVLIGMLVAVIILVGVIGWILMTLNGPGLIFCTFSGQETAAIRDFLDIAETAMSTPRMNLAPVILEMQKHQRAFDRTDHPACVKSVADRINSGMRSAIDAIQNFSLQREVLTDIYLDRAHDDFKAAYDMKGGFAPDVRLSNANLFVFHRLASTPTSVPYRELATQRPYPTDAPTPTATALPEVTRTATPTRAR